MSSSQPSDQVSFEQAVQFDSTQTRLSPPAIVQSYSLDNQDSLGGTTIGLGDPLAQSSQEEAFFEEVINLEGEIELESVRNLPPTINALATVGSDSLLLTASSVPTLTTSRDDLWTQEEDQELLRIINLSTSKTRGGRFKWSSIESDMQDFWLDTKNPGFTRVKGALKARAVRLKAIQEAGLTVATYKSRPFTPEEDAQILALQADQLHNATEKPSINWGLAVQQFVARPRFELKERRDQLLAKEKQKLKTEEKERKMLAAKQAWETAATRLKPFVRLQAGRPRSPLPPASQFSLYDDRFSFESGYSMPSPQAQASSPSVSLKSFKEFSPSFAGSSTFALLSPLLLPLHYTPVVY